MTHVVNDGLSLVQATGRKLREGVGSAATGIRDEVGAVAHGIGGVVETAAERGSAAAKRKPSAWPALAVELVASAAGALAAFFVSRLVRSRLSRRGE